MFGSRTSVLMLELRHLGGALGRAPAVPNAVGGRDAAFCALAIGTLAGPAAAHVPAAVDGTIAALAPYSTGGSMVNLHGVPGDAADRARCWPPAVYHRLQRIKAPYDPANLFRLGHAI